MYVLVVGTAVRHLRPGLCLQALTSPIPQSVFTQDGASYLACFSFCHLSQHHGGRVFCPFAVLFPPAFNENASNVIVGPVKCQCQHHGRKNEGMPTRRQTATAAWQAKPKPDLSQRANKPRSAEHPSSSNTFSYICKHAHLHRLGKSLPIHIK